MERNTSFFLESRHEKIIDEAIVSGRYDSREDVLKRAFQLLEEEEFKYNRMLREELEAGENCRMITDFDHEKHLTTLRTKHT